MYKMSKNNNNQAEGTGVTRQQEKYVFPTDIKLIGIIILSTIYLCYDPVRIKHFYSQKVPCIDYLFRLYDHADL